MNKKVLIGIIAAIVAVIIAVVCIVVLPGDKDDDRDNDRDEKKASFMVDGEPAKMGKVQVNARMKTCLANQREIQAQLNNGSMSGMIDFSDGDVYELRTSKDGTECEWVCINAEVDNTYILYDLFQEQPHCPVGGNVIRVTIENATLAGSEAESFKITTECCGDEETHNNTTTE